MYKIAGILGALLVLFGFYRISIGKWTGRSMFYEFDNLMGAGLIAIYQYHYKVYITMVVNIIWAIVAFRGIVSYQERRKRRGGR
jgi:multisubunit Na+/H+ antiporter MnhF subunit